MTHHTQIPRNDMCSLAEAISTLLRMDAKGALTDQIEKVDRLRSAVIKANPHQYSQLCAAIGINPFQSAAEIHSTPEKLDRELSSETFHNAAESVIELAQQHSILVHQAMREFDDAHRRMLDLYPEDLESLCDHIAGGYGDIPLTSDTTGEQLAKMVQP